MMPTNGTVVEEAWIFDEETEERYLQIQCEVCAYSARGEDPHTDLVNDLGRDAAERLVVAGTRYALAQAGCPHVLRL